MYYIETASKHGGRVVDFNSYDCTFASEMLAPPHFAIDRIVPYSKLSIYLSAFACYLCCQIAITAFVYV